MRTRNSDALKRAIDIIGAAIALVLLSPLLIGAALAIVLESGRPVFFRQVRAGKGGLPFTILKFRTMAADTPVEDVPLDERNPGITRVGRVLRATSIDELPQLVNVLRGEMSLIGPRPTIPAQVVGYDEYERRRLEVRPGITGWAQVNGRNSLPWAERIRHDVWYVDNRCFGLDCRIVWRTLRVVLQPALVWGDSDGDDGAVGRPPRTGGVSR